jgi:phosphoribosylanthranilate isomerase
VTDVKICGLTRPEDVALSCELGARYVGFNFAAVSPRRVGMDVAGELARATAPGVERVGIFVGEPAEEIRRAVDAAQLDLIQIHRPLTETDLALARPIVAWLGVDLWVEIGGTPLELAARCRAILVDTAAPGGRLGGTGRAFDWSALEGRSFPVPVWLAGGLRAENVAEAIRRVRPAAVDVASGVESAPGIKDRSRMEAFFLAVKRADREAERDAQTA